MNKVCAPSLLERRGALGTIVHEERLGLSFGSGEYYDSVPVVGGIYLSVGSGGLEDETVLSDTVVTGEDVGHSLGATLG